MTRNTLIVALLLYLAFANASFAGSTTTIRHESSFVHGSPFQLNSDWLVYTKAHFQSQLYTFWDSSSGSWKEVDMTMAPIIGIPHASISFPIGLRFRPEENWRRSHAITKANIFGRAGVYPFFMINELSWALSKRNKNEHFLQQQVAYQPKSSRLGLGAQAEQVLVNNTIVSAKVGPVLKLVYSKSASWSWTVDVVPFYDLHSRKMGIKANFITFHFGK